MANVSFEAQPFLPAAAGSIHLGPNPRSSGHSEFDPILIPSDDESDYGISDDGDSDTTFPSVDEIFARLRKVGSDSDLGAYSRFSIPCVGQVADPF
ncbi:hypothetical protein F4805DRAFT_12172 [Annulohypoxylon moriforme]|nr:hypothetical protein F4805DRAFT_12172 [Annulohypoxylon moriforme]